MLILGKSPQEICRLWEDEYDSHIDAVLSYFSFDEGRRDRLLIYDLSEGNLNIGLKLSNFLQPHFPRRQATFSMFDFRVYNKNKWKEQGNQMLKIKIPSTPFFRYVFLPSERMLQARNKRPTQRSNDND